MERKLKSRKIYYYEESDDKEEKKDKRRLFYLLFLLALTAIMLSTTTYAWFTTNRIVTISNIDVKVQAEGSLDISADGTDWKALLDYNTLIGVHGTTYPTSVNHIPAYLKPVSTIGELDDNGLMKIYLGIIGTNTEGANVLTASKTEEKEEYGEEAEGYFIAFDLFLRINSDKNLYLTNESKIIYNGNSTGTENATRVAFIKEGTVSSESKLNAIQSLHTTDNNNVYIWEPNYDTHTANGVNNARYVYGITTTQTNGALLPYYGIKAEIPEQVELNKATKTLYPNYFEEVTPSISTIKNNTEYKPMFPISTGITKMRVYMWLEGQDVDCENSASIGNITLALQFSTNPSA